MSHRRVYAVRFLTNMTSCCIFKERLGMNERLYYVQKHCQDVYGGQAQIIIVCVLSLVHRVGLMRSHYVSGFSL